MALVKKLLSGGTPNSLDSELNKELLQYNLRSKDERKVRDALIQFRDYFATPEGKSFVADELTKKYTVTGQGGEKFAGSPDEIKSNWFTGKLKIENDEDARSVAAAIFRNATKNLEPATDTTPVVSENKTEIKMGDIGTFMRDVVYGTEDNMVSQFGQIKNNEERKNKIFEAAQKRIEAYKNDAKTNTDLNYSDLDKLGTLEEAITTKNWDKFISEGNKFKWESQGLLLNDTQKKQLAEQKQAEDAELKIKTLESKGLVRQSAIDMLNLGYDLYDNLDLPGVNSKVTEALQNYIKSKNGFVWRNPNTGQQIITNKANAPLNADDLDFGRFSPLYGYSWNNNLEEGFSLGKSTLKLEDEGDIGKGLDIPKYYGWKATGWSRNNNDEEPALDKLKNRDYTKYIELSRPGHPKLILTKDENGVYHDQNGEAITDLDIKGYKSAFDVNLANYKELFPNIEPNVDLPLTYDYKQDIATLKNSLLIGERGEKSTNAASSLVAALIKNSAIKNNIALKQEILDLLAKYHDAISVSIPKNKAGGILKAQKGAYFNEYRKRMTKEVLPKEEVIKPMRDITGTWKDQSATDNTLDAVSMAGTAASFIPGVGAIGAGVTMGADLVKDLQDGKIDNWGTHALNAGFVALSAIGLGGVKALVKIGKSAKVGEDILKAGKTASKYNAALKLPASDVKALNEFVALSEKAGLKTSDAVIKRIAKLKEAQTLKESLTGSQSIVANAHLKTFEDGLKVLDKVSTATMPKFGSITAGKVYETASKGISKAEQALSGKFARNTARAAMIAPAIPATLTTIPTWYKDGFEYTKPEDISKMLIAGSVGKTWIKDIKGMRALNRQLVEGTTGSNKTVVKVGDQEVTIDKVLDAPKPLKKKSWKVWEKDSKIEAKNTKSLEEYKQEVLKAAHDEGKIIHKAELDKLTLADFKTTRVTPTGKFTLPDEMQSTTGNRTIDARDYDLAKKYWGDVDKSRTILTPEQIKKIRTLQNTLVSSKGKNPLLNKELAKEIEARKAVLSTSKPNKVGEKQLKLREKQLQEYKDAIKKIRSSAKGGIIKYQNAAAHPFGPFNKTKSLLVPEDPFKKYKTSNLENLYKLKEYPLSTKFSTLEIKNASGGEGSIDIKERPGIKEVGKLALNTLKGVVTPTNISNLLMYANTRAANIKIGNDQRKAVADSMYQLPFMQHQYIRINKPNSLLAEKQAAQVRSQAKSVARATSDMNMATATQLQGEKQAEDIVTRGQMQDLERMDKLQGMQLENKAQVDQYNVGVLGKNRGMMAEAAKNIHLINANQELAQNTNLNNLMLAVNRSIPIDQYKQNNKLMFEALANPEIKKAVDAYNYAYTTEKQNFEKKYNDEVNRAGKEMYPHKTFEESPYYTEWMKKVNDAKGSVDILYEPIKKYQLALQYQQPLMFMKKGGATLSKEDRLELIKEKAKLTDDKKEAEMIYKAIMHNNEMLQKALIKVFK